MLIKQDDRVWKLGWLTPIRCRIILILVLLGGALGHWVYLNNNCPIDLSGDEAQYWDWSRNLDLSYYSKGPLVAYIIRASCHFLGETMPAVRLPAIVLSVATSVMVYLLTVKLFQSEKLALGAVLLNHLVPMFVAGSVLMTIDPPMFFCWACATYFAAVAIFDDRKWAWVLVGLFVGVGFLAKYSMFLWLIGLVVVVKVLDPRSRDSTTRLSSPKSELVEVKRQWGGLILATIIALLFTTPVVIWNQRHGWVSLSHVSHQIGAKGGSMRNGNFFEFIASQIGVIGPILAVVMIAAIIYAFRNRDEPNHRQMQFLVWIGLPFFALTAISSLIAKVQVNWPAPAYFTLMILSAYFISTRLRSRQTWKPWSGWIYAMIGLGVLFMPIVHDISITFPLLKRMHINPAKVDFLAKLRGWQMLGNEVSLELRTLDAKPFILCDDYMQTAEMAFYVNGQPKTYYAGSYYVSDPKRFTQYDMWPDRSLKPLIDGKPNPLLGRDAIYIGKGGPLPPEMAQAFNRMEKLPEVPVMVRGVVVKTFKVWKCYKFKGMNRLPNEKTPK